MSKLEIFGSRGRWSASFTDSGDHGGHKLGDCPFCGQEDTSAGEGECLLELTNTHTPYYNIECRSCGAQGPSGFGDDITARRTKASCAVQHELAQARACALWNERYKTP